VEQIKPIVADSYIGCSLMKAKGYIGGRAEAPFKAPPIKEARNRIVLRYGTVDVRSMRCAE
jgi:hypothetical protein